jgi:hypothetical protein
MNVDKVVEIPSPLTANFQPFNSLLLFAPFVCNFVFSYALVRAKKLRDINKIYLTGRFQAMIEDQTILLFFLSRSFSTLGR